MGNKTAVNHERSRTKSNDSQILEIKKIYSDLRKIREEHAVTLKMLRTDNKRFLALIGHDIKTPMSSIIGYLSFLKERIYRLDQDEIVRHLEIALLSAKRSFMILDNLLEWAIAENEIKSFNQQDTDLMLLLDDEIKNIELYASIKKIRIELKNIVCEPVYIDANMIRAVLRNILNNAVKYTHEGGAIIISTKRKKNFIEVIIKDNGIGMKQEMQDLIFSRNNYDSRMGTGNETGTGFGLILCKGFIDKHGGKIIIESEPENGSVFRFTLPMKTSVTN